MKKPAPILVDTFSLCEWLLEHLGREQDVLARILCENAVKLLEAMTFALRDRFREEHLAEADDGLITIRMQLRLAGATGLLSEHQMLFALESVDRIGRQLGGWQRSEDLA